MRKLGLAVLVLAVVHGGVSLARAMLQHDAPVEGAPGPMTAAAGGPITDLALQFHRPGPAPVLRVFGELLAALDPATRVHVVVTDAVDERAFERIRPAHGPAVRYVRSGRVITSWIHDRLLVLDAPTRGGAPTLLAPPEAHQGAAARVADWRVPWDLHRAALSRPPRVAVARFQFDGGDLIADERRVYLAPRLLRRNADPARSREALLREVQHAVGREVVVMGDDEHAVPDHHIGMFVTPIGGGRVLVADVDLAMRVLDGGTAGQASIDVGGAPLTVDRTDATRVAFANLARALRAEGLQVIPLPALPSPDPYVLVSYGNAMLEHRRDGRLHVYMPTYGIARLDDAAIAVYRSVGAVVHPIRVDDVFRMGGSVGCLVAPLVRADGQTGSQGS